MRNILAIPAFCLMLTSVLPSSVCAANHASKPGYASFIRTTIVARYADLAPSIEFWRDVMGFDYGGDPKPRTGYSSPLGWSEDSVTYFTIFTSTDGAMLGLLMVEDSSGFPKIDLPAFSAAHGGVVLVHTAVNLKAVYDRAVDAGIEILKPYALSRTGASHQILIKAPTGQLVEVYELVKSSD